LKYRVITTQFEKSGKNENILYLGEWCRSYKKGDVNKKKSVRSMPYHWDDRKQLYSDFQYLQKLNDQLILELTPVLNSLHSVTQTEKYWRLLLGYWVNLYTAVLFDRWNNIKQLESFEDEFEVEYSNVTPVDLSVTTTGEFVDAVVSDQWNHCLYSLILGKYTSYNLIKDNVGLNREISRVTSTGLSAKFIKVIKGLLFLASSIIGKKDKVVLVSSYFNGYLQLGLYKRLNIVPKFWASPILVVPAYNNDFRKWTLEHNHKAESFEFIVRELLPTLIPRVFVEGYEVLSRTAKQMGFPEKPKVILTSISHFTDELFKCWAADKQKYGCRLLLGEHGGFGTGKFNGAVSFQMKVADRFLSTGWKSTDVLTTPIGNFRAFNSKQKWNNKGRMVQVCVTMPRYSFDLRSMTIAGQMLEYFEEQFSFVKYLTDDIRNQLDVRLYPDDYGWNQKQRWFDRYPNVNIDNGSKSIWKLVEKSRLFISTYNATTYIESLSFNIPTIIFWNPKYWEINDNAAPFFEGLERVGIFHKTPKSAAKHVALVWDDVASWWFSNDVQETVKLFCNEYASNSSMLDKLDETIHADIEIAETAMATISAQGGK